jgi:hypothetical protein
VTQNLGLELEVYTPQGLRTVTLAIGEDFVDNPTNGSYLGFMRQIFYSARKSQMENSIASLGSHDGFDLIRKDTGEEIYWNRGTGKPAISSKDLARLLNCDPKMVARKVETLNLGLESEMYTQLELKLVTLVEENAQIN